MLAREPLDRRQALFERVQRDLRAEALDEILETVGRCPLAVVAQLGGEVLGLDRRARACARRARRARGRRRRARPARRSRAAASCAPPGGLAGVGSERVGGGAGGGAQRVEPAQALARGQQLLVLVLVGSERVDLGELVLEQVELALALGGELAQLA